MTAVTEYQVSRVWDNGGTRVGWGSLLRTLSLRDV